MSPNGLVGSNLMFDPSMVNNMGKDLHCKSSYGSYDMEAMSTLALTPDYWKENCPGRWQDHQWLEHVWPAKVSVWADGFYHI